MRQRFSRVGGEGGNICLLERIAADASSDRLDLHFVACLIHNKINKMWEMPIFWDNSFFKNCLSPVATCVLGVI